MFRLHVEFPGFEPYESQLTLRRGAMNQTVTLKIAGVQEEVVVNDMSATDDRRGNSFTTTLEQAEIDELPDDPEELAEVLTQMAGAAGAVFQVNGFRGGRLPSRDEIRQIRFRTNSLSADNHDAGRTQIEIITRPNVLEWNGNASLNYRGDEMNARNAFATAETPEQNRQFNMGLRGPLVQGQDVHPAQRRRPPRPAVRHDHRARRGRQPPGDVVFRPSEQTNLTVGIEHALTKDQTLRLEYRRGYSSTENLGVGGFNLPERGYDRSGGNHQVRAQLQGLIGKTTLNEIRLQFTQQNNESTSLSDLPAVIVLDAFSQRRRRRVERHPPRAGSSSPTTSISTSDASTRCASASCSRATSSATSTRRTTPGPSLSAASRRSTPGCRPRSPSATDRWTRSSRSTSSGSTGRTTSA